MIQLALGCVARAGQEPASENQLLPAHGQQFRSLQMPRVPPVLRQNRRKCLTELYCPMACVTGSRPTVRLLIVPWALIAWETSTLPGPPPCEPSGNAGENASLRRLLIPSIRPDARRACCTQEDCLVSGPVRKLGAFLTSSTHCGWGSLVGIALPAQKHYLEPEGPDTLIPGVPSQGSRRVSLGYSCTGADQDEFPSL